MTFKEFVEEGRIIKPRLTAISFIGVLAVQSCALASMMIVLLMISMAVCPDSFLTRRQRAAGLIFIFNA